MSAPRCLAAIAVAALLAGQAAAQTTASGSPAGPAAAAGDPWSFSFAVYNYFVPDERNYASPVFAADRGWLHLEGRYNYEDRETGSLWAGYNLSAGAEATLDATLMLGGVFGETAGVAPGCEVTVAYERLEFYTEGEYLIDTEDHAGNFVYFWSELTYSPAEWFRAGLVTQRTRAYETDLDVQRGLLLGFSFRRVEFAAYVFNLGWTEPTTVLSLAIEF